MQQPGRIASGNRVTKIGGGHSVFTAAVLDALEGSADLDGDQVVTFGELYAAIGLLLGLTTRWAAGMSLFILINLAIGGYYDASLIPFFILNAIFLRCHSVGGVKFPGYRFGLSLFKERTLSISRR